MSVTEIILFVECFFFRNKSPHLSQQSQTEFVEGSHPSLQDPPSEIKFPRLTPRWPSAGRRATSSVVVDRRPPSAALHREAVKRAAGDRTHQEI